jgi:hypothetical protein
LSDSLYFKKRKEYFEITCNFVDEKITLKEFIDKFNKLRVSHKKTSLLLKKSIESSINLQLDIKSEGFYDLICVIDSTIKLFDITINDNYIRLEEYKGLTRLIVKNNFLVKLENYCK